MNALQTKTKSKSSKTSNPRYLSSKESSLGAQGAVHSSNSVLSTFYSTGPVFSLSNPVQTKVAIGRANDAYEQEADSVAQNVTAGLPIPPISHIPSGGLGERAQLQEEEREEQIQELAVQRQEEEEKEEKPVQPFLIQRQAEDEKEETIQEQLIQRQAEEKEKEETIQEEAIQRDVEEEPEKPVQTFRIQRQEEQEEVEKEEESVQTLSIQRQKEDEKEETIQEQPIQLQTEAKEKEATLQEEAIQRDVEEEEPGEPDQTISIQRQESIQSDVDQRQAEKEEHLQESKVQLKEEFGEEILQSKFIQQKEDQEEEPPETSKIQEQEETKEEESYQTKQIQRQEEERDEETCQTKQLTRRESKTNSNREVILSSLNMELTASRDGGSLLPSVVRTQMEPYFHADLSHVRVHTDQSAHEMNRALHSKAFTNQHHIYFRDGHYTPGTNAGKHLIAHELTHVMQQGAMHSTVGPVTSHAPQSTIQRSWFSDAWDSVTGAVGAAAEFIGESLEAGKRALMRRISRLARNMPGYRLLGVVLGRDPISGDRIVQNGRNFIEAGLDVIPNGRQLRTKLDEEGALGEAAAWLDTQIELLDFSPEAIIDQFGRFWNGLSLSDLADPEDVFRRVRNIFVPPIGRLFLFARNVAIRLLEIVKDYILSRLISFVRERTRAYPLLTVILGRDPISGDPVERTPMNLIRGFMQLSEDGEEKLRQMEETGTLQRAANWIDRAITRITRNLQGIRNGFLSIWNSVTIQNLMNPIRTFMEIYRTFAEPVGDILSFLIEVGAQVLRFIKDALISRLVDYARTIRGYPLLAVILGRCPFSGEPVPRTAHNLIHGFLSLLSDGEERYRNLQESGAIDRTFTWLSEEVERLDLSWPVIRNLFRSAWESLSIRDIADPIGAFRRIVNLFRAPVGRIIRFVVAVGEKILEFVFEGIMGAGGSRVLNILKRARDTFLTVLRDPPGFIGNLINAIIQGFQQFANKIFQHLQAALISWLFGALQGEGLQLPERLDLRGIISLGLQFLGITYARIRPRLVRHCGERAVSMLERTFAFLRDLVREGPIAAWRRIIEYAGNLRDRVIEGIRNWVVNRVVIAGVGYVVSLFTPASAVIQAIRTIYNTIMWFIERINQIMALVESISNSISNIASGNISPAANYIEQSLARILPLIISFFARLLGLGGISNAIRRIIQRIRQPIDLAIDQLVRWICGHARRLWRGGRALVRRGVSAVRRGVARVREWWRQEHRFTTRRGESHRLYFRGTGRNAQLRVASNNQGDINEVISDLQNRANQLRRDLPREALVRLDQVLPLFPRVRALNSELRDAQYRAIRQPTESSDEIQEKLSRIGDTITEIWRRLDDLSEPIDIEDIEEILEHNNDLKRIWQDLYGATNSTTRSKQYFREKLYRAWDQPSKESALTGLVGELRGQISRTETANLTGERSKHRVGPNICQNRTVAKRNRVELNVEIYRLDRWQAYGTRASLRESDLPSSRGEHAEYKLLEPIQSHLNPIIPSLVREYPEDGPWSWSENIRLKDNPHIHISVDRHPCPRCEEFIHTIRDYGITVDISPEIPRIGECGE